MRGELLEIEFVFTNNSMPADAGGVNKVGGFTTGDLDLSVLPLKISVTGGPAINRVIQNQPVSGYNPYVIDTDTVTTLPSDIPKVGGKRSVLVAANVTRPSAENIQDVRIYWAETDSAAISPVGANFTSVVMTLSDNYYYGTIPAPTSDAGRGVWYYIYATSNVGNFARKPDLYSKYFYYQQQAFNKCNETPMAPAGLDIDSTGFLTWSSVTQYEGGFDIPSADAIKYNVYRKGGFGGSASLFTVITTVSGTNWTDPAADGTATLTYAVTAVNSCTNPAAKESVKSDSAYLCMTGGVDCVATLDKSVIYSGDTFAVTLASCSMANNTTVEEGGAIVIDYDTWSFDELTDYEKNDSGVVGPLTFTASDDPAADNSYTDGQIYALNPSAGIMESKLYIYSALPWTDGASFGCATSVVTVIVNPCSNTPDAPVLNSAVFKTTGTPKGVTLNWDPVTTNTDGTPAVYYNEKVNYEVWYNKAGGASTLLGTFSDLTPKGDGTLETFIEFNGSNNTTYNFWVVAADTCTPLPNESAPSNVAAIVW